MKASVLDILDVVENPREIQLTVALETSKATSSALQRWYLTVNEPGMSATVWLPVTVTVRVPVMAAALNAASDDPELETE